MRTFKTGVFFRQIVDQQKKNSGGNLGNNYGTRPKSLGARRGLNSPFIPPIKPSEAKPCENEPTGASDRNSNGSDPEKFVGIFLFWLIPRNT